VFFSNLPDFAKSTFADQEEELKVFDAQVTGGRGLVRQSHITHSPSPSLFFNFFNFFFLLQFLPSNLLERK